VLANNNSNAKVVALIAVTHGLEGSGAAVSWGAYPRATAYDDVFAPFGNISVQTMKARCVWHQGTDRREGDVTLGDHASVWFYAVLRGNINYIKGGHHTNIQEGTVVSTTNSMNISESE